MKCREKRLRSHLLFSITGQHLVRVWPRYALLLPAGPLGVWSRPYYFYQAFFSMSEVDTNLSRAWAIGIQNKNTKPTIGSSKATCTHLSTCIRDKGPVEAFRSGQELRSWGRHEIEMTLISSNVDLVQ